uniref:Uncharacterized protein n=1 Tax=Heterorhabditis bacteriophora TaxID=37862 RepID=A0A1I7XGQ2_HETBA
MVFLSGVECCANGRMTPTEMLQSGLEKSLNTSEIKMEVDVNCQKNENKRDNSSWLVFMIL